MPKEPDIPIAPILEHLGAEQVPRVTGTAHAKMLCPFHPDNKPSASVSQFGFVCWACGVKGDAISLMKTEGGLNFADAKRRARELAGVSGENLPPQPAGWAGAQLLDL